LTNKEYPKNNESIIDLLAMSEAAEITFEAIENILQTFDHKRTEVDRFILSNGHGGMLHYSLWLVSKICGSAAAH
jgi:transketolase